MAKGTDKESSTNKGPGGAGTEDAHKSHDSSKTKTAIVLKPIGGDSKQRELKFDKDRIVVGSVISADVRLTGEGVAPIHAVLERSEDPTGDASVFTIFDLASATGVFVNEDKVVAHVLKPKDKITIGRYKFTFSPEVFDPKLLRQQTRQSEGRTLFLNPAEDLAPLLLEEERFVEQIFDFRPQSKKAVEVVMSWCGTILDVGHFVNQKTVTLGHGKSNDFGIPPLLSAANHPVIVQDKQGYTLNVDSKMTGVIQRNGKLEDFDKVRAKSSPGAHGAAIPFNENDFAKISIGDIEFYFSFTAAPPKLKRRRLLERDPFFQKIFYSSMIFSGIIVMALMNMKVQPVVDAEQMPDRIATILYEPEKFMKPPEPPKPKPKPKPVEPTPKVEAKTPPPPPPKPEKKKVIKVNEKPAEVKKPLPKVMDYHSTAPKEAPKTQAPPAKPAAHNRPAPKAEAKEGEGAKAKGAAGTRGEKDKPVGKVLSQSMDRPSPNAGNKGASGASEVSDEGNVDLLKGTGGKVQDILGGSGAHLGEGSKNLKGFGNFGTHGSGGQALSGHGSGGGGDAETTLGGLGNKGSGMGRVGTGKGAAGNGTGIVGSQIRVDIRSDGPEEAIVMGGIDRNAVAEAIYAHRDEFRLCYEREVNAETPNLAGTVATSFVIGASGRVTQAGIESSSLKNENTERCVIKVLKRIEFPMPRGGGVVEVHFPFKFSAASH